MIKNIIFDWGGTLSDDVTQTYEIIMTIFEKFGAKRISLKKFRKEFELPYMKFYKKYVPNLNKEEQDKLFAELLYSFEPPKPYPGVKKTLEFLIRRGIKVAILASHPKKWILKKIKDYEFTKFFIYVKGNVHDKTEEIVKIMHKCGFEREETAYVGDMVHDIEAGKKAKIKTIAIYWGIQPKEKLLKAKPDFIIDNIEQLKEFFNPP